VRQILWARTGAPLSPTSMGGEVVWPGVVAVFFDRHGLVGGPGRCRRLRRRRSTETGRGAQRRRLSSDASAFSHLELRLAFGGVVLAKPSAVSELYAESVASELCTESVVPELCAEPAVPSMAGGGSARVPPRSSSGSDDHHGPQANGV